MAESAEPDARRGGGSARRSRSAGAPASRASDAAEPADRPRPSTLRRLTDEEIELWTAVARSVTRRRGANLPKPSKPKPAPPPVLAAPAAPAPMPPPRKAAPPPLAPLERRLKRDLLRGRAVIDDGIDLHGLTQAEAHLALRGFLVAAQARGARLVIVVTGKGATAKAASSWFDEPGVLKRHAPHWLREADLRSIVLGFEEAGPAHGGSGALYVRLRRRPPRG